MVPKNIKKEYSNGEITVVWQPSVCIHSTKCWRGADALPEVFNPQEQPWIKINSANSERIIQQVKHCPSGALSYYTNNEKLIEEKAMNENLVEVTKNGPLLIHGNLIVKDQSGNSTTKTKVTAFCRCGASANKPYCDGSHRKIDFKTE